MDVSTVEDRMLSELDHARLSRLVERQRGRSLPIEAVLDGAELLPSQQVPPDRITMHSKVLVADPATGERRALTVCYPDEADAASGAVSVLSPVGMGLLGLPVGATAHWRSPAGEAGAAQIVALLYQPEANGEYTR